MGGQTPPDFPVLGLEVGPSALDPVRPVVQRCLLLKSSTEVEMPHLIPREVEPTVGPLCAKGWAPMMFDDIPLEQHALVPSFVGGGGKRFHPLPYVDSNLPVQPRSMDPSKDIGADGELEAEAGEAASDRTDGGKD
ncbi:hypothetical protein ZWY2020_001907 [Hordeum vulgare]|nr:hypothetical protein ZWY2020_001907 [Hordeum vulgare]